MKRNLEMQQRFLYRLDGVFNLPDRIVPIIDENSTCIHGKSYIAGDEHLRMMSPNILKQVTRYAAYQHMAGQQMVTEYVWIKETQMNYFCGIWVLENL